MNAGLRRHQFVKESAEEVLEHAMSLLDEIDFLLGQVEYIGDLVLFIPTGNDGRNSVDGTFVELGVDCVGLKFDKKLRLPEVIEVVEEITAVDFLVRANAEDEG